MWSVALDNFLAEMRSMVDYRNPPGQHPGVVEDTLISKLKAMRIHEESAAQKEVRYKLEDAMDWIFEPGSPDMSPIKRRPKGM